MKKIIKKICLFIGRIFKVIDKILITPIMKIFLKISDLFGKNNKTIEQIFSNKQSLVVVSLIIAFLCFYIVDRNSNVSAESSSEVLNNQPVKVNYNEEAYVVEGLPETVDVILMGKRANIYLAKQHPGQEVSVDLRELSAGTHKVKLKYTNEIKSINYKIDPSQVTVIIYDKVSSSREVTAELVHRNNLDSKLDISEIALDKSEVTIKGSSKKLDTVAYVKALVDIDNLVEPTVGKATISNNKLVAYNNSGEIVDVEILPDTVDADVTLASSSKMVPIRVIPEGNLAVGYAIESITPSSSSIMIYGNEEALAKIDAIPVTINVNGLNADKTFNVNIQKPTGVRELGINSISIKLTVTSEQQVEITGVQVSTIGLDPALKVQAVNAESSSVDVIVKGSSAALKGLDKSKVTATIDLSNYKSTGEYEVPVSVTGEDTRLSYSSKTMKVKIRIYK